MVQFVCGRSKKIASLDWDFDNKRMYFTLDGVKGVCTCDVIEGYYRFIPGSRQPNDFVLRQSGYCTSGHIKAVKLSIVEYDDDETVYDRRDMYITIPESVRTIHDYIKEIYNGK